MNLENSNSTKLFPGFQLTIVLQGPIPSRVENLNKTIATIRGLFPKAELIVSTWEGQSALLSKFESPPDHIVLSQDPGPDLVDPFSQRTINATRQRVSTLAGLRHASRPHCLKMRTDFGLTSTSVYAKWVRHNGFQNQDGLLRSSQIGILSLCSRDPEMTSILFHPSDFMMVGETECLIKYWSADSEPVRLKTIGERLRDPIGGLEPLAVSVEQNLFIGYLNSRCDEQEVIKLQYFGEMSLALAERSIKSFHATFQMLDPVECGVLIPTHLRNKYHTAYGSYKAFEFNREGALQKELERIRTAFQMPRRATRYLTRWYFRRSLHNWIYIAAMLSGGLGISFIQRLRRWYRASSNRVG